MTPEEQANRWNEKYEVGIKVNVKDDFGDVTETTTRSEAWNLCGSPVILLKGVSGGYLLERCTPIEAL